VDAPQALADGAAVFPGLMSQKRVHAMFFNFSQVGDHAHTVFRAIAGIQLLQTLAWHIRAFITIVGCIILDRFTMTDDARPAAFGFIGVLPPTPGTFSFRALKGQAQGAVHPARSDQSGLEHNGIGANHIYLMGHEL
jgi:hypothetical protein